MIITNNEQALRVFCESVSLEEIPTLIQTLEQELAYANKLGKGGVGLAAPQIGIAKHIAIIRYNDISINLVNAKLKQGYDPAMFKEEGCLSFPGRVENTTRFQEVHIENNLVDPNSLIATGFTAVICQHELDHLNSTLFMDRAIPTKSNIKAGMNDPCPCGSGKKYKRCCR
jgi:peptide deformylase